MAKKQFHVYILANKPRRLYIGVTSSLEERVQQHKAKQVAGFTARYNIDRLVYYEEAPTGRVAIEREKQLKGWLRSRKIALIESVNPGWEDLAESWFAPKNDE
jgi:putative endonuclease